MGQPKLKKLDDFENVFGDELEPGHKLMHGQYTIEEFLNAGGFGITYRARDSLNRIVVIKECFPGSLCRRATSSVQARSRTHTQELSSIVRLFVEEARSLARLDHPNIVGVHQVFEENNTAYMALDFVEGRDLLDMIEKPDDVLEPEQVEVILRKLLDAIGFIHKQGILHRDISPDNVLIQPNFEPILIDFGAAREEAGKKSRILSAMRVVKDGYSPQEFYISGAEQGHFSDLYALGATFYHLITGELPANSQTRLAAVAAGEPDPYVPVVDRMPAYSEQFLSGIDMALQILPRDRIPSAEHWLGLLDGTVSAGAVPQAPTAAKVAAAPGNRSRALLLGTAAILVPIIVGISVKQSGVFTSDVAPAAVVAQSQDAEAPSAAVAPAETAQGATVVVIPAPAQDATTQTSAGNAEDAMRALLATRVQTPVVDAPVATEDSAVLAGLLASAAAVDADLPEVDVTPAVSDEIVVPVAVASSLDHRFVPEPYTLQLPAADVAQDVVNDAPEVSAPATVDVAEQAQAVTFDWAKQLGDTPAPEVVEPASVAVTGPDIESYDLPQVISGWSVDLASKLPNATDTIFDINALPIDAAAEIDTVLHNNFAAPDGGETEVTVLVGPDQSNATYETLTVPVVQKTLFANGIMFEARMVDGAWTTTVIDAPSGLDIQAGDILVGDLATGQLFGARTSLPDLLVQANADNREKLTLAIRRGDNVVAIDFAIPG